MGRNQFHTCWALDAPATLSECLPEKPVGDWEGVRPGNMGAPREHACALLQHGLRGGASREHACALMRGSRCALQTSAHGSVVHSLAPPGTPGVFHFKLLSLLTDEGQSGLQAWQPSSVPSVKPFQIFCPFLVGLFLLFLQIDRSSLCFVFEFFVGHVLQLSGFPPSFL